MMGEKSGSADVCCRKRWWLRTKEVRKRTNRADSNKLTEQKSLEASCMIQRIVMTPFAERTVSACRRNYQCITSRTSSCPKQSPSPRSSFFRNSAHLPPLLNPPSNHIRSIIQTRLHCLKYIYGMI